MKEIRTTSTLYLLAGLFILGLTGCDRPVKKGVAEWKAEGNVEKLVTALRNPDRRISIPATQALGELKVEQAVEPLAALFTHPDSQQVVAAIQALISIGNEAAETHLIEALKLKDAWAKTTAINGLVAMKSTRATEPLIEMLNASDREATEAAVALGLLPDKKAIQPLAAKTKTSFYLLRLACVESIGSIGGEEAATVLADLIGDEHSAIRAIAIDTLIAHKSIAAPHALDALHGKNAQARQSAAIILKGIDAVPASGKLRIFYLFARVPPLSDGIDHSIVLQLAGMGNEAVDMLIKAASHKEPNLREHAFRALESIGKPCVSQVVNAVETRATPAGKQWFSERTTWAGAPSWRLDLWGAATAINPEFIMPRIKPEGMTKEENALQTLKATQSEVRREYIPLLIPLLAPVGSDSGDQIDTSGDTGLFGSSIRSKTTTIDYREITEQRLFSAGDIASFPLMAATGSSSKTIAEAAAELLRKIQVHSLESK